MSKDFLNNDKLATLTELRYLLLEVLDRKESIEWHDLSIACKERSLNFAYAFENTILFLQSISVVKINDQLVNRIAEKEFDLFESDYELSTYILEKTVLYLGGNGLLQNIFNKETVVPDPSLDLITIHTEKIPQQFFFIKVLLLNLDIAKPDKNTNAVLLISSAFRDFFKDKIWEAKNHSPQNIQPKTQPGKELNFFISYAHVDEPFKVELIKHLSGLKLSGLIKEWHGREILPGQDWDETIKQKLDLADVILFLVSADFMASDYIKDVEIEKAIERHNKGLVRIIPIIIRDCDHTSLQISRYQALPAGTKPISNWENKDAAYLDIVNQIKKILKQQ